MGFGTGLEYVVKSILALVVIIFLANKLLAYLNTVMKQQTKSLQIIERMPVNKNSSICIVELLGNYYLMSFTEGRNEILKEFSETESEAIRKLQAEKNAPGSQLPANREDFKETYEKIQQKMRLYMEKRK